MKTYLVTSKYEQFNFKKFHRVYIHYTTLWCGTFEVYETVYFLLIKQIAHTQ